MPRDTQRQFESWGGTFVASSFLIRERLQGIKALVFDWDGVFHSGYKNEHGTSAYSEADSMGVNMLRFALYLQNGPMPYTAIITGENNPTAKFWAEREHLDEVFMGVKHKSETLEVLKKRGIEPDQILFVFDDILDISLAQQAGLRFLVSKPATHSFVSMCRERKWCDYITANSGAEHAVREVCELSLSLMGSFQEVVDRRVAYDKTYQTYLQLRNSISTSVHKK